VNKHKTGRLSKVTKGQIIFIVVTVSLITAIIIGMQKYAQRAMGSGSGIRDATPDEIARYGLLDEDKQVQYYPNNHTIVEKTVILNNDCRENGCDELCKRACKSETGVHCENYYDLCMQCLAKHFPSNDMIKKFSNSMDSCNWCFEAHSEELKRSRCTFNTGDLAIFEAGLPKPENVSCYIKCR